MLIGIGCDPNASELKDALVRYALELGHEIRDFGSEDTLYPRTAISVAESVARGEIDRGVVLCGTGIGVSIAAIKFLMGYIKKHDFKVFGWYRIALGVVVLAYFLLA